MTTNTLTQREREILGLASAGLTNQRIAEELGISRNAVRYHLKEIHSKLETGSERMSLVRHRWTKALGLLGMGVGAARAEVIGVAALAAVAVGGVGLAVVAWDGTDRNGTYGDMRAWPECEVGTDRPCVVTATSMGPVTLAQLAASLGTTEDALRHLNPDIPFGDVPAHHPVKIPVTPRATADDKANDDLSTWRTCEGTDGGPCLLTVRSESFAGYGMTLGDLAATYGVTEAELRALNPSAPTGVIEAGYEIVLPVPEGSGVGQAEATSAGR